jgi:DNA-binding MarR family transcriptional regulator
LHYLLFFATVHFMNNGQHNDQENLRSFLLMSELESGEPVTQREIAGRLGIALGLVNSYLKTLAAKGFVTVKAMPRNRFAYLLTPKGFAEKSRLAFQHLSNFNKLYRITRRDSLAQFTLLRERGVERVSFCGLDDLTEIAYLSLQEARLELEQVIDDTSGGLFLGREVIPLAEGARSASGPIVVTALQRAGELKRRLMELGVEEERIYGPSLSYEQALA